MAWYDDWGKPLYWGNMSITPWAADQKRQEYWAKAGGYTEGFGGIPGLMPGVVKPSNWGIQISDQPATPAAPQVQSLSSMLGLGAGSGIGLGLPTLDVNQYRDIADPFWQQRGQYQTQLSNLMSNPGAMTTSPMYQFALDQGMNAVNRTAAAQHMLGSGNRLADLTKFGQGLASQQFFPMASLLSNLAGANAGSPGAALSGLVQSRGQDVNAATDLYKTNAQLAIGLGDTTLGRDKFNYQVGQDTAAEAAAKKALSDYQWNQAYNNLYSNYSFG